MSCSISLASAQSDIRSRAEARKDDPAIAEELKNLPSLEGKAKEKAEARLEGLTKRYDAIKQPLIGDDPATQARSIKRNPLYTDPVEGKESNWLGNSMEKLERWFAKRLQNRSRAPKDGPNLSGFGNILTVIAWVLLGALLAVAFYFLARHIRWKGTLKRRATAVLEDDEPERTLDEWLELANEHEAAGRYREAVRCLYLACLLKFDEGGVARFDRGQTNWEHLSRIQSSPHMPEGLDFTTPTKKFDRIWYGFMGRGIEDVQEFRATYLDVKDRVARRKAA